MTSARFAIFVILPLVTQLLRSENVHFDINGVDANYTKTYTNNVSKDLEIIYDYHNYGAYVFPNKSSVRVHISAEDVDRKFPVFVVVRQQETMTSWEIPLTVHNAFRYYNVSRTLCHELDEDPPNVNMSIDISTASPTPVYFTLWTSFYQFEISIDEIVTRKIAPSEPQYVMFAFPDGVDSVLVKATSKDSLCMVLSIQHLHCPVFDQDMNVRFTGSFQTMTKKAGLTVQKVDYPENGFYVVFVLKPNDVSCTGIQTLTKAAPVTGGGFNTRHKKVSLQVTKNISGSGYLKGILGAVFFFLMFYVIAGVAALIHHLCARKKKKVPTATLR